MSHDASGRDTGTPSPAYRELVGTPLRRLEGRMRRATTPDEYDLAGWEWRGTNLPATSRLLGIRRFVKGFVATSDGLRGYNVTVPGADLASPWRTVRRADGRREWAPFSVTRVAPEARDNRYLDALLLDYGTGDPPEPGLPGHLRDYLTQVDAPAASGPLLLGRAFVALGTLRMPVGWFVLERMAPIEPADASPGAGT